jgi:phosphohistidine phosphatase SixA
MRNQLGRTVIFAFLLSTVQAAPLPITIFLTRHAEKAAAPADNPGLTEAGVRRANALAAMLADSGVTGIYTSEFLRTQATAQPLADRLHVKMNSQIPAGRPEDLARKIVNGSDRVVLVVGHSNTVPKIIQALGAPPVSEITDTEYDNLFVVTIRAKGKASVVRLHYGEPSTARSVKSMGGGIQRMQIQ